MRLGSLLTLHQGRWWHIDFQGGIKVFGGKNNLLLFCQPQIQRGKPWNAETQVETLTTEFTSRDSDTGKPLCPQNTTCS
jgi:hypothetical protein